LVAHDSRFAVTVARTCHDEVARINGEVLIYELELGHAYVPVSSIKI